MQINKQSFTLPIKNHDIIKQRFKKHGKLFEGASKRAIVVGPSGCGKTNVILSLLTSENGLRFANIYVFSKSLYQEKYKFLKELIRPLKEIGYFESSSEEDIIPPHEVNPNSVMIFDDIVCSNQSIIRDYFCFGRHKNTDCFYLCQTYSSIPKQLIRDNTNLLVLFKQDTTNLKHIYDDHVNTDMSFQQFKELCSMCWKEEYAFVVIDKDCDLKSGRYRKGFDCFICL